MAILLQIKDLEKEYGEKKIFSGLSFAVSEKKKIGVIGVNGAGKSTLFKIITKEEKSDGGKLIIHKDAHIGYLKQNKDWKDQETGLAYLMRCGNCQNWQAKKLASKFELKDEKLNLPAENLSGGWRMRLRLCGELLKEPNLLLLDEPSNYLDLNTLILLENYLSSYRGSCLIISHDRDFLKKTCQETIEIAKNGCYHYPGDIDSYLSFKEQKLSSVIKANESLAKQQAHWQDFIDRFRYKSSKAKQAQSLMKKISKLEEKRVGLETKASITRIKIPVVPKKHNFVLRTHHLDIGYQKKVILKDIEIDCLYGEKLAVLGLNGEGKTTFIKTICKDIPPVNGSFKLGRGTRLAWHSQETMERMNKKEQAGDFLRQISSSDIKTESILKMASDFLFQDEDLKKPISVLSGGEKSRLLLAGLLLSKPDMLILDEPTCHLDFDTTEALGKALKEWIGTVIFTSHDRSFSRLVATGIIEIENGRAQRKSDNYDEYIKKLEKQLKKEVDNKYEKESEDKEEKRKAYHEYKTLKRDIKNTEKQISEMEEYKKELMSYFLEHYENYSPKKVQELEDLNRRLKDKEDLWIILNEELDKAELD